MLQCPVSARFAYFLRFNLMITQPLQARVQVAEISRYWHVVNPRLQLRLKKLDMRVGGIEQGGTTEQKIHEEGQCEMKNMILDAECST
jgi:hypothetical protein